MRTKLYKARKTRSRRWSRLQLQIIDALREGAVLNDPRSADHLPDTTLYLAHRLGRLPGTASYSALRDAINLLVAKGIVQVVDREQKIVTVRPYCAFQLVPDALPNLSGYSPLRAA